jgi:hypothetical protein
VRVGRAALDEDAIRVLEETHPDVPFDWSRMLKEKPPAPAPGGFEELPRRRRGGKARPQPQPARSAKPAPVPEPPPPDMGAREVAEPDLIESDAAEAEAVEPDDVMPEAGGTDVEGEEAPAPARHAEFFDAEILMRLRARYAELKARIAQRIADPTQRDVLRAEAERLNPDTWVTEAEARTGLDQFERWFEAIRMQLPAPHRRRRRRKKRGGGPPPASQPS